MGRAALVLSAVFLWGQLTDPDLRALVLGQEIAAEAAVLPDHALRTDAGAAHLLSEPGAEAPGLLLRDLAEAALTRLEFYAAALGLAPAMAELRAGAPLQARLHLGKAPPQGAEARATAGDIMALYGVKPAAAVAARLPQMQVRGAARVRAADAVPAGLRRPAAPGDVAPLARREPYAFFFAVEEHDLRFRRFDGSLSPQVTRAAFLSGDAVTVLPYDPTRDRVLLVEQFRAGPFARGDRQPWQLEAIAGRIDPGETPEDAARREAVEEAGLTLGALLPVAGYYPSPGICAEYLYSYVALCDLPDGAAGVFGVEGEAEDIRGHLIGFDDLMTLVATGEAGNAPLLLTALWLQRERPRLRRETP
ncbi:NUDIX domain-containing protein [Tabrizicola sp. SY72]|nr:NUDIX domain-containing protein [Tabrizicola sp. SY72]